jgi:alcohol dehydrogenase class IV
VDKVPAMAQAMGLEDTGFVAFHAHICGLLDQIGIPKTLADIGVPADCAPRIAAKAIQDSAAGTNPRALTVEQIVPVIEEAVTRGR